MPELTSRYSIFISLLLITASLAVSFYFYKKTNLSAFKKYILIIIKTTAFFIILFLFLEPSILALVNINRSPVNIVLIDDSRSNVLYNKNKLKDKYNNLDIFRDKFNTYSFSVSANPPKKIEKPDSLYSDGFETNLSSALENVRKEFPEDIFNSFTIISDGNFNSGGNPLYTAKTFQCPFITLGIGDTIQEKDIAIENILYNKKAFTGTLNKINVQIKAYGYMNESVNFSLIREGKVIAVKTINIDADNWTGEITFNIEESDPGTIRYRVAADSKPKEFTYKNNYSDFLINYLQNKINILYISDGPGYDNAVMTNILKRIKNYNITIKTVKSSNDFYEGPLDFQTFGELSAVFLHGFPPHQFSTEIITSLSEKIKTFNIPLIFFSGKNTDYKKLDIFSDLIPFTIKNLSSEETVNLQGTGRQGETYENIFKEMSSSPPVFIGVSVIQKGGSEVLLTSKTSSEPVLITRNNPNNKSAAFLGYGFWKWRLNSKQNYEPLLEKFLLEIINMSLIKDKKSKLVVIPEKDIFDYSEDLKFTAEVYDENFNPIKNTLVKAKIFSGQNIIRSDLIFSMSENKYYLNAGKLQTGDYVIKAEAELNGNFYVNDEARFLSDTLNDEYKVTRSNFENLRLLADNTQGRFFTFTNTDSINNYLNSIRGIKEELQLSRYIHFNLWENRYVLLFVILLFSIEWIIRKRNNIP